MSTTTVGFKKLKHFYDNNPYFRIVYASLLNGSEVPHVDLKILNQYFYKNCQCLPNTSLHDKVMWDSMEEVFNEIRLLFWGKIDSFGLDWRRVFERLSNHFKLKHANREKVLSKIQIYIYLYLIQPNLVKHGFWTWSLRIWFYTCYGWSVFQDGAFYTM